MRFSVTTQDGMDLGIFWGDSADDVRCWIAGWYRHDPRHLVVLPA